MLTEQQAKPKSTTYFHLKAEEADKGDRTPRVTLRLIGSSASTFDTLTSDINRTLRNDARTEGKPTVDNSKQRITIKVRPGCEDEVMTMIKNALMETNKYTPATPVR